MVVIKKVLNSSVVLVEDERNAELILLGKGVGFGKKRGDIINNIDEMQTFIPIQSERDKQFVEVISEIPYELLDITKEIVNDAKLHLNTAINDSLYFMLADHLSFAIERQKNALHVNNRIFWEIKSFYPEEFEIGLKAIALIQQRMQVDLTEQEAANIAFHVVNAQVGKNEQHDSMKIAKAVGEILKIIQYGRGERLNENSINYTRLVIHVKFFVERYFEEEMLDSDEGALFSKMLLNYPDEVQTVNKVSRFMKNKYGKELTAEEKNFLIIHLTRLKKV